LPKADKRRGRSRTERSGHSWLLAKSKPFPNGLANNGGQVGRHYFSHHTGAPVAALCPAPSLGAPGLGPGAALAEAEREGGLVSHHLYCGKGGFLEPSWEVAGADQAVRETLGGLLARVLDGFESSDASSFGVTPVTDAAGLEGVRAAVRRVRASASAGAPRYSSGVR